MHGRGTVKQKPREMGRPKVCPCLPAKRKGTKRVGWKVRHEGLECGRNRIHGAKGIHTWEATDRQTDCARKNKKKKRKVGYTARHGGSVSIRSRVALRMSER